MRHQQRDHERNLRRGTYGEARNERQGQQQQRREAREGGEDRWQSAGENFYNENEERGFGQADRHDHSYGEAYRGSWSESGRPGRSRENENRRSFGGQGYGSPNYDVNRSYSSGREDFGSNSRMAGGWNETAQQQKQQRSNFYGRGPKGYKRSDERITEEVHEVLTWNDEVDASEIEIQVKEGEVTLSGSVSDRRMKRLAEELIEDISGVRDVINQLKLKKEVATESSSGEESRESKSSSSKKSQSATAEKH